MSIYEVKSLLDQLNDQLDREMEKIEYLFLDCFVIKSDGGSGGDLGRAAVLNGASTTTAIGDRPYDCGDASSLNADAYPFTVSQCPDGVSQCPDGASQCPDGASQCPDDVSLDSGRNAVTWYRRSDAPTAYNGPVRLHRYTSGDYYRPRGFAVKKQNKAVDIIDPATGEKVV